eukprot:TRINITY_DN7317_c1_g2_i2.p2 TRINITY_DN7317_c1_g2~~TRINITY_DN7317_c1_g2_i2.p2  ORF type:complete len:279 (+),score=39.70 TRINITY_DN7317_c1_g2_i2:135-971(+)
MAAAGEARLGDETIAVLAGRIDAADPDQKDLAEELECSIGGHPAFECSVETAPCSHIFHRDCLGRWLEGKVGGAHCCPVCREVLPPGRLGGTAPSPAAPASPSAGRCGSSDADSFYTAAAASAGGCTALPGGGSPPLAPPPPLSPEPGGGGAEAEAAAAAGEQFDGTGLRPPALTADFNGAASHAAACGSPAAGHADPLAAVPAQAAAEGVREQQQPGCRLPRLRLGGRAGPERGQALRAVRPPHLPQEVLRPLRRSASPSAVMRAEQGAGRRGRPFR